MSELLATISTISYVLSLPSFLIAIYNILHFMKSSGNYATRYAFNSAIFFSFAISCCIFGTSVLIMRHALDSWRMTAIYTKKIHDKMFGSDKKNNINNRNNPTNQDDEIVFSVSDFIDDN